MTDLLRLPALELAALLRARKVASLDLVDESLERIEAGNPALQAFADVMPERARAEARSADGRLRRRGGGDPPPFLGVPLAVKDLNLARGSFTRFGSRAFERLFTPFDDPVVALLRRAGFVIVGKTTTSELGALPVTEPDIHPPARNPWDPDVTPGGSSGGAGIAVAAGMVPVAQGSDAGGSIRIPSSFCNLFGIKPSRGRVVNPFLFEDERIIWSCGPMTRTVDDAAAMLDVMAGLTSGSPHWAPPPPRPFAELARERPPRLRVRMAIRATKVETEPEIGAAVERVAELLSRQGHTIETTTLEMPEGIVDEFLPLWQATTATAPIADWSVTQPVTRWLGEQGRHVPPSEVQRIIDKVAAIVLGQFGDADVWLTPTVAVAPPRIGAWRGLSPRDAFFAAADLGVFTAPFNVSGQPAATVPAGRSRRGHPIGVQIAGRPLADGLVLGLARQIERAMPWADDRPELPAQP